MHSRIERFSMQWAGFGMLLCIFFCILFGCGQQESTSENETNRSVTSIDASKSQFNEKSQSKNQNPDTQTTKAVTLKQFDVGPLSEDIDQHRGSVTPAEINPDYMEVIPPLRPGEHGITQAEIKARIKSNASAKIDPDSFEVIPPLKPGDPGITQAEVKAQRKRLAALGEVEPDIYEVLPPRKPGESGITQAEVIALKRLDDGADPESIEVIPPNKPGEPGVTQTEINALRSLQAQANLDLPSIFESPVAK